jgi:hypothetical protein
MRMLAILAATIFAGAPAGALAADLPLFDAHIHYSHDAVEVVPPPEAIKILRDAGIRRALLSSSGDEGTQKLVALAPELVLPSLRPYRTRSELSGWTRDPTIVAWMEERLAKAKYVAIGEFHVYGEEADLPNVKRAVELARKHNLVLHAHADVDAIERIFRHDPKARVLWAHSGFQRPEVIAPMLALYKSLRADLAFRNEHGNGGKVDSMWRALFTRYPDRFMVGTDTFTPERWHYVAEHAKWTRAWLADLPKEVAERIAWRNGEAMFAQAVQAQKAAP